MCFQFNFIFSSILIVFFFSYFPCYYFICDRNFELNYFRVLFFFYSMCFLAFSITYLFFHSLFLYRFFSFFSYDTFYSFCHVSCSSCLLTRLLFFLFFIMQSDSFFFCFFFIIRSSQIISFLYISSVFIYPFSY